MARDMLSQPCPLWVNSSTTPATNGSLVTQELLWTRASRTLRNLGPIRPVQGYWASRPVSVHAIYTLLSESNSSETSTGSRGRLTL